MSRPEGLRWRTSEVRKGKGCSLQSTKKRIKIYVAVFLLMFANSFSITMLFPFLPFMVKHLIPEVTDVTLGNYAGAIPTAMFAGRFFSSYIWGFVADAKGRKPVVIFSSILLGLAAGGFGFSVTFTMAVFLRFLVGLFNGIPGAMKAVLSESSDDKNQAMSIAVFSTGWGMGMVMGPAVGGALADPVRQYGWGPESTNGTVNGTAVAPQFIVSFLQQFPYSLPCLVNSLFCLIGLLAAIFLLPETLHKKRTMKYRKLEANDDAELSDCDRIELSPLSSGAPTGGESSESLNQGCMTNHHSNGVAGGGALNDSGHGSLEESSDRSASLEEASFSVVEPSVTLDADMCGGEQWRDQANSVQGDRVPEELETGGGAQDTVTDGLHQVPFSVDRSNSARLAYFSGSIEELLEHSSFGQQRMRSRKNSLSAFISRRRASLRSLQSAVEDPDCCLCCCRCSRLAWLHAKTRRMCAALKALLKNMWKFLRDPTTRKALIIYLTFAFAVIGYDEMFSVFAKTDPELGGLGMEQKDIGIVLSIVGAMMLPVLFWLFPVLERTIGAIKCFQFLCIVIMVGSVLTPSLNAVARQNNTSMLWGLLITTVFLVRLSTGTCFAAISLFINNSVYFDQLASVNGLALSLTAASRTISPVLNGVIWASSLSEENRRIGFPVDYHLIFVLFGVIYLLCVFIVALLPKSISKQKKAPPEGTEAEESVHDEGERTEAEQSVHDEGERTEADSHSTVDNPKPIPNVAEEDTETYL